VTAPTNLLGLVAMPIINGRYYMNPQYGAALERAREAGAEQDDRGATWLDRFLGFVPAEEDEGQSSQPDEDSSNMLYAESGRQNNDDLEAQNRNNDQTQQNRELNPTQEGAKGVADTAGKYGGSTDWAFARRKGAFGPNTNKCNQFVGDVTTEAGVRASVIGRDGKSRYPLAAEWADPNTKIANWRVLQSGEMPQPGDVAAYKLSGGGASFSGHSGIVTSVDADGTVHAMAAHEYAVGPDDKFQAGSRQHSVVFRRNTGGR
jgi:hypothetical protein